MAFKIAVDKAQAKARRITPNKLGDFEIDPTEEEKIENLKLAKRKTDLAIVDTKKRGLGPRNQEVIQLKAEATRLCAELTELGARRKFEKRSFNNFLIDVIKERMTKAQFDSWVNEAHKRSQEPA